MRRLLVAVALVAVACGGGGSKAASQIGSADILPGATTTYAPAGTVLVTQPPSSEGQVQQPGQAPVTVPPPGSGSSINLGVPAGTSPDPLALSYTGQYARVLLPTDSATRIEIQLIEQSGAAPNMGALNYVVAMIHKVSGKPVSISAPVMIPGGAQQWSIQSLNAVADKYGTRNLYGASVAVLHWQMLHGFVPNPNGNVLGLATRADVETMLVDQTAGGSLNSQRVITAVYTHETGHLLGLVDQVLHEHRADPNDPSHCGCHSADKNSVMYWMIDTSGGILSLLTGGPSQVPIDFDAADYGDLAKIRAGQSG